MLRVSDGSERVFGYWVCSVGSELKEWAGIGFGLFRKGLVCWA